MTRMNLGALALIAAASVQGGTPPASRPDGIGMSDEDRAKRDSDRLAHAPRRIRRAEERRQRKAAKRLDAIKADAPLTPSGGPNK